MVVDGSTFVRRAQRFFQSLQANRFPNASSLASECGCSANTAQRTIYRLRDEYLMPIEYDSSSKGYYLTDRSFAFPSFLPAGKDELTALLLARDLVRNLEAKDLDTQLESLWDQFASTNPTIMRELGPLSSVFSSDSTVIADIADVGVLTYVTCAKAGESVRIRYRSPWRHTEDKTYDGRIERVHYSDGALYLLVHDRDGRERILNASFIRAFEILSYTVPIPPRDPNAKEQGFANWLEGFGVWAGQDLHQLKIAINPPAAQYYAAQRWHVDQVDTWEGEVLVRSFPGIISPEVVRRVLSLGRHVKSIHPPELATRVLEDAALLVQQLQTITPLAKVT